MMQPVALILMFLFALQLLLINLSNLNYSMHCTSGFNAKAQSFVSVVNLITL